MIEGEELEREKDRESRNALLLFYGVVKLEWVLSSSGIIILPRKR